MDRGTADAKIEDIPYHEFLEKKPPLLEIISLHCEISLGRGQLHYYGSDIY